MQATPVFSPRDFMKFNSIQANQFPKRASLSQHNIHIKHTIHINIMAAVILNLIFNTYLKIDKYDCVIVFASFVKHSWRQIRCIQIIICYYNFTLNIHLIYRYYSIKIIHQRENKFWIIIFSTYLVANTKFLSET